MNVNELEKNFSKSSNKNQDPSKFIKVLNQQPNYSNIHVKDNQSNANSSSLNQIRKEVKNNNYLENHLIEESKNEKKLNNFDSRLNFIEIKDTLKNLRVKTYLKDFKDYIFCSKKNITLKLRKNLKEKFNVVLSIETILEKFYVIEKV